MNLLPQTSSPRISPLRLLFLGLWILLLHWAYCGAWPRPADDFKNFIFYQGLGLIALASLLKFPRLVPIPSILKWLLAAYAGVAVISIFRGAASYEGVLELSRLFLWAIGTYALVQLNEKQWCVLLTLSTVSAALIAVLSLFELHGYSLWQRIVHLLPPSMNPIGHFSYYGTFMAAHVPMAVYLLSESKSVSRKILWGIALLLTLAGLWISGTRSSMVGLAGAGFVSTILLIKTRSVSWKKMLGLFTLLLLILVVLHKINPQSSRGENTAERWSKVLTLIKNPSIATLDSVSSGRGYPWIASFRMFQARPLLGWGLGGYRFSYPEFDFQYDLHPESSIKIWFMHPHNEILDQLTELGLLGAILFFLFWGSLYFKGYQSLCSDQTTEAEKKRILLGLAGITISLGSWMLDTNYQMPLSRLTTAISVAILLGAFSKSELASCLVSPLVKGGLRGILFFLILISQILLAGYDAGLYAVARADRATSHDEKMYWSTKAFQCSPGAFEALFTYAVTQLNEGDPQKAERGIQFLYDQFPRSPLVLYHTARQRLLSGRREEAIPLLEHSIQNDAHFEGAKNLLCTLQD
ncbi:MAG: O-antigen ligase family protein [Deltaproteobacteria bacterium]|nr:O-antigen ligase family protein [Deltaproteobacteria bacterium]